MTTGSLSRTSSVLGAITRVAAFAAVWIPVAALVGVQTSTARITQYSDFTAAMIHTMVTSTFAVILACSMLTNAIIVSSRAGDRPLSLERPARLPLALVSLIVSSSAWTVVVLADYRGASPLIPVLALVTAALSAVVLIFALRKDPASQSARAARLEARSHDPRWHRRRHRFTVGGVSAAIAAVIAIGLVGVIPQTRTGCQFDGGGQTNGQWSLFSSNCGAIATTVTDPTIEMLDPGSYTVITQGYRIGLWPQPILLELRAE